MIFFIIVLWPWSALVCSPSYFVHKSEPLVSSHADPEVLTLSRSEEVILSTVPRDTLAFF
jgi:hypothetical protein